jgi:hypothetical protein
MQVVPSNYFFVLAAAKKGFRGYVCCRVFELPLMRNAQKRDGKKTSKTTEGGKGKGGKKTEEKKPIFLPGTGCLLIC